MIGTEEERLRQLDEWYPVWEENTLWTHLVRCADRFPENEYVVFEDCSFTYRQLKEQVEQVARGLFAIGVRPGDKAAVFMRNCPEFVFLTFALSKLGAIRVPINTAVARDEFCYLINHIQVDFLFSQTIVDHNIMQECRNLRMMVVTGNNKLYEAEKLMYWPQMIRFGKQVDEAELEQLSRENQNADSIADIMFTSGSMAYPKGVALTHDMLLRASYGVARTARFEPERRIYAPVPLFHIYANVDGLLAASFVGGAIIMNREKFNVAHALRTLRDFHVNGLIIQGPMLIKILTTGHPKPEDYPDLHSVFFAVCTPDWIWEAVKKSFGVEEVATGFGMTELCCAAVMTRPGNPVEYLKRHDGRLKDAGSAGVPSYHGRLAEIKIVDPETLEEVPHGVEGEICWRGVTVTRGYYNEPEINKKVFTDDGWFLSGDFGVLTAEGDLTFHGRIDAAYKINGENVSPFYVDSVIGQCPNVRAVATMGIKNPKYGNVGVAFIDPVQDKPEIRCAIIEFCTAHLASFQIPKYFFFSDSKTWPRTGSEKLSKKLLREMASQYIEQGDTSMYCEI